VVGRWGSRNTILAAPGLQRALPARVRGQHLISSLPSKSCENESDALNSPGRGRQSQQIWQRGGQILRRFCCKVCLAVTQERCPSCSPRMEKERMNPRPAEVSAGSGLPQHHSMAQAGQSPARTAMWLSSGGSTGPGTSSASPSTGLSRTPPGRLRWDAWQSCSSDEHPPRTPAETADELRLGMSLPLS